MNFKNLKKKPTNVCDFKKKESLDFGKEIHRLPMDLKIYRKCVAY